MKNILFIGLIIGIVLASGCVQQPIDAALNSPFQLKIGQEAQIDGERLQIKFLNLTEDSRCPSGVQCIWEGRAKISIEMKKGAQTQEIRLATGGNSDNTKGKFMDYEIKLMALEPYPKAGSKTSPSDYTATLIVSKEDEKKACEADSDCVPATCCHPDDVVIKKYAPNCTNVICTAVCLGPLDCGAGRIACISDECRIIPTNEE